MILVRMPRSLLGSVKIGACWAGIYAAIVEGRNRRHGHMPIAKDNH